MKDNKRGWEEDGKGEAFPPETAKPQRAMGGRVRKPGPSYLHGPASGRILWEIERKIRLGLCPQKNKLQSKPSIQALQQGIHSLIWYSEKCSTFLG